MFLSDKRTNGCREILTINLPWLVGAFGAIRNCVCVRKKITSLSLDYPDSYLVTLEHENGNVGVFVADLAAREAICRFRVESEDMLLEWDGKPDTLREFDTRNKVWHALAARESTKRVDGYQANIIENAYAAEIDAFFAALDGTSSGQMYGFQEDLNVLSWIDRIEAD